MNYSELRQIVQEVSRDMHPTSENSGVNGWEGRICPGVRNASKSSLCKGWNAFKINFWGNWWDACRAVWRTLHSVVWKMAHWQVTESQEVFSISITNAKNERRKMNELKVGTNSQGETYTWSVLLNLDMQYLEVTGLLVTSVKLRSPNVRKMTRELLVGILELLFLRMGPTVTAV